MAHYHRMSSDTLSDGHLATQRAPNQGGAFGGEVETAEVLKISQETVMRDWKFAKNWWMRELSRPN
jgi:hypothetical protein